MNCLLETKGGQLFCQVKLRKKQMKFRVTINESTKLKPASYFDGKDVKVRYNEKLQKYYASNDGGMSWDEVSRDTAFELGY